MTLDGPPAHRPSWRRLAAAFGAALLVPAGAILLHELGHFAAHAAFGYEINRLTFASVTSGSPPPTVDPEFAQNLSFSAGASVSLLLAVGALGASVIIGPHPVVLATVMAEAVRAVATLVRHIVRFGPARTASGGFGEIRYANRALDGPGALDLALSAVEFAVPLLAVYFVWRQLRAGERARVPAAVFAGVLAGASLWLFVVGPAVLPR